MVAATVLIIEEKNTRALCVIVNRRALSYTSNSHCQRFSMVFSIHTEKMTLARWEQANSPASYFLSEYSCSKIVQHGRSELFRSLLKTAVALQWRYSVWAIEAITPVYVNVTRISWILNIVLSSNAYSRPYAVTSLMLSECRINDEL